MDANRDAVTKRRVFYIPGFDPNPPRRYRELYRSEGHKQAQISGYDIAIKAKPKAGVYSWLISSKTDDARVQTKYDVLVWRDLVQASMAKSILGTYLQLFITSWRYIGSGALRRLAMLRKGPVLAALYPIVALLVQLGLALFAMRLVTTTISNLTWPYVGLIAGLPLFVFLMRWFKRNDRRFFAYYLMNDYAYWANRNGATPPELSERLDVFRSQIAQALQSDVDEVVVVGHSSGAQLAVQIIAEMARNNQVPKNGPKFGLLTIGQVIPMVSFLPDASDLRRDLNQLSKFEDLFWLDISAPGDGCCFALCDPVAVSGVTDISSHQPRVLSAAFSQTLKPDTWAALKRRYFRIHFQYLCAFDNPGDYDYFQITAGPKTLAARFKNRKPSKSRIDVAASPYTHMSK